MILQIICTEVSWPFTLSEKEAAPMTPQKPDRRVVWTWVLCALTAAVPPAAVSLWLLRWHTLPDAISTAFTALWGTLLLVTLTVYIPLRRRHMAYSLDDSHLCVWGGVLFRTEHRMPISSVRHVTILQGPLERRFDTAFLLVNGAGGFLLLEGLSMEQATAWRRRLLDN